MIANLLTLTLALPGGPPPCTDRACAVTFDWGPGKTAGDYPTDMRYGPASDLESAVRRALTGHGFRLSDHDVSLTIIIRPSLDRRAMCDETAGTGTAFNCLAISDVTVRFSGADSTVVAPPLFRIANRCAGGAKLYARTRQFGDFVGEMIWWSTTGKDNKEKRPPAPC
jgi:hypothetical protein